MTSTHAAMRRQEIASLGFHYDNVIMEEAAQITEIENFIPLALQNPQNGELPLQRIVLCGDHLQNSPIIQNLAFRQYANLEQSLFQRLVRLGVPTIMLDQQGRARPRSQNSTNGGTQRSPIFLLSSQPRTSRSQMQASSTSTSSSTSPTTKAAAKPSQHRTGSSIWAKPSTQSRCSCTCACSTTRLTRSPS